MLLILFVVFVFVIIVLPIMLLVLKKKKVVAPTNPLPPDDDDQSSPPDNLTKRPTKNKSPPAATPSTTKNNSPNTTEIPTPTTKTKDTATTTGGGGSEPAAEPIPVPSDSPKDGGGAADIPPPSTDTPRDDKNANGQAIKRHAVDDSIYGAFNKTNDPALDMLHNEMVKSSSQNMPPFNRNFQRLVKLQRPAAKLMEIDDDDDDDDSDSDVRGGGDNLVVESIIPDISDESDYNEAMHGKYYPRPQQRHRLPKIGAIGELETPFERKTRNGAHVLNYFNMHSEKKNNTSLLALSGLVANGHMVAMINHDFDVPALVVDGDHDENPEVYDQYNNSRFHFVNHLNEIIENQFYGGVDNAEFKQTRPALVYANHDNTGLMGVLPLQRVVDGVEFVYVLINIADNLLTSRDYQSNLRPYATLRQLLTTLNHFHHQVPFVMVGNFNAQDHTSLIERTLQSSIISCNFLDTPTYHTNKLMCSPDGVYVSSVLYQHVEYAVHQYPFGPSKGGGYLISVQMYRESTKRGAVNVTDQRLRQSIADSLEASNRLGVTHWHNQTGAKLNVGGLLLDKTTLNPLMPRKTVTNQGFRFSRDWLDLVAATPTKASTAVAATTTTTDASATKAAEAAASVATAPPLPTSSSEAAAAPQQPRPKSTNTVNDRFTELIDRSSPVLTFTERPTSPKTIMNVQPQQLPPHQQSSAGRRSPTTTTTIITTTAAAVPSVNSGGNRRVRSPSPTADSLNSGGPATKKIRVKANNVDDARNLVEDLYKNASIISVSQKK